MKFHIGIQTSGSEEHVDPALSRRLVDVVEPTLDHYGAYLVEPGVVEVDEGRADALIDALRAASEPILDGSDIRLVLGQNRSRATGRHLALAVGPLGGLGFAIYSRTSTRASLDASVDSGDPNDPDTPVDLDPDDDTAVDEIIEFDSALEPQIPSVTLYDGLEVVATSAEQIEMVTTAVDRMSFYGFDLPTNRITIRFDPSRESCDGNVAYASHGGEESLVVVCHDYLPVVVHELTHVWAATSMTDADRDLWVEQRGLDSWSDGEWRDRGSEHLAEVVASGLADRFRPIDVTGRTDVAGTKESFAFIQEITTGDSREWWSDMSVNEQDLASNDWDQPDTLDDGGSVDDQLADELRGESEHTEVERDDPDELGELDDDIEGPDPVFS